MKTVKKLAIGFAFAASFITTAFASTVDTSSGGYYDGYEAWGTFEVGNITFATGTNAIMALTTSVDIADQGWGGECPACEPVYIALFDTKNQQVWGQTVAGAVHGWTHQEFDIATDLGALNILNAAMSAMDYSAGGASSMKMFASPIGWGGWELHVANAGMSITSDAANVPEPASLALLGLGLLGITASRRKFDKK